MLLYDLLHLLGSEFWGQKGVRDLPLEDQVLGRHTPGVGRLRLHIQHVEALPILPRQLRQHYFVEGQLQGQDVLDVGWVG